MKRFVLAFAVVTSLLLIAGLSPAWSLTTLNPRAFSIGPVPPPDPWPDNGKGPLAIGPVPPPDPWPDDGKGPLAIGPVPPPDPWPQDGRGPRA